MNTYDNNVGLGDFWRSVRNIYLQYAVELGLPGLLLIVLLLIGTIRSVHVVRHGTAGDPALRDLSHLAEGLYISLLAFTVEALFHPVAYQFYFYFIAGLVVALRAIYDAGSGARTELVAAP